MHQPYKILTLLALALLLSLSCKTVTRLVGDSTPWPTDDFSVDRDPLVFEPDALPEAQIGEDYSVDVIVVDPYTPVGEFSLVGELPPGLELKPVEDVDNTAEIRGTPTEAGTYSFIISVWCYGTQVSGQTGEKEYTIVVR